MKRSFLIVLVFFFPQLASAWCYDTPVAEDQVIWTKDQLLKEIVRAGVYKNHYEKDAYMCSNFADDLKAFLEAETEVHTFDFVCNDQRETGHSILFVLVGRRSPPEDGLTPADSAMYYAIEPQAPVYLRPNVSTMASRPTVNPRLIYGTVSACDFSIGQKPPEAILKALCGRKKDGSGYVVGGGWVEGQAVYSWDAHNLNRCGKSSNLPPPGM